MKRNSRSFWTIHTWRCNPIYPFLCDVLINNKNKSISYHFDDSKTSEHTDCSLMLWVINLSRLPLDSFSYYVIAWPEPHCIFKPDVPPLFVSRWSMSLQRAPSFARAPGAGGRVLAGACQGIGCARQKQFALNRETFIQDWSRQNQIVNNME